MRAGLWLAAALVLATSASAAEPKSDTKKKEEAAETPREKMEKKKAAAKSAGQGGKAKTEVSSDVANRVAAVRAKSVYLYAVEACEQPARCDAQLRDSAERAFMEACRACAPAESCDAEKAAILDGSAKRTKSPCP